MIKRNFISRTNHSALLFILALAAICMLTGCKEKEKLDPSTLHTTAASETMVPETAEEASTTAIHLESESDASDSGSSAAQNVTARTFTYSSGQVTIEYPAVVNLPDEDKTKAIDTLMKENALSVIKAYGVNETEDTLDIKCRVVSADRNRITVVYTGSFSPKDAAHPVSLFYTNTIDVQKVSNIGLDKFADPYTMAGYVLSGDCQFPEAGADVKAELMNIKNETSLDDYTTMFQNADFPFDGTFPESFSYEYEGDIYFSIPVPHALGDYAVVMYSPDAK